MKLEGAISLVTGAARGIGFAVAEALAGQGALPILVDADHQALAEAAAALDSRGTKFEAICCDVRSDTDMESLAARVLGDHGRLDILVSNAGAGLGGPFETIPVDDWRWILDLNVLGTVRGLKAFLPSMIAAGRGHVVNVASSVALFGNAPHAIPYVTSKAAIVGLSRSLRLYLAPKGIGVTLLCPDNTDTGFRQRAKVVGLARSQVVASLPATDQHTADEVADSLMRGLHEDRFLVSLTADAGARLVAEARAMASDSASC